MPEIERAELRDKDIIALAIDWLEVTFYYDEHDTIGEDCACPPSDTGIDELTHQIEVNNGMTKDDAPDLHHCIGCDNLIPLRYVHCEQCIAGIGNSLTA